jgi:tryptophan-rich hypothetical protein
MKPFKRIVNPKKLLHSKWTTVTPINKEKYFIVIKLVLADSSDQAIELIELEAVHSKQIKLLPWQQLNDVNILLQGWV